MCGNINFHEVKLRKQPCHTRKLHPPSFYFMFEGGHRYKSKNVWMVTGGLPENCAAARNNTSIATKRMCTMSYDFTLFKLAVRV